MIFFKKIWRGVSTAFLGTQRVAALEISHSSIKYLSLKNEKEFTQSEIRLEPGIIEQGKVKDRPALIAKLKALHSQITNQEKDKINVHLVVSSGIVFSQPFTVPLLPNDKMSEAINLNLQMLSPTDINKSYYGWQKIEKREDERNLHLLGAFADAETIKEYEAALQSANFHIFSIEFPAISLSRLIATRWDGINKSNRYLVINLNSEGLLMLILKKKNLYFSQFTPWVNIVKQGDAKNLSFEQFSGFLSQEIQRVLNFYLSRHGEKLVNALLISPLFNYEIFSLLRDKFKMKAGNLILSDLPELSPSWFSPLGAGLRKITSKKEGFLTLSQTSSKQEYSQDRVLNFIRVWRKFTLTPLIFLFISFLVLDTLVLYLQKYSVQEISYTGAIEQIDSTLAVSEKKANAFNATLNRIKIIKDQENHWSPVARDIISIAQEEIKIIRIFSNRESQSVLINGSANDEKGAIDFKNRLENSEEFTNVSLPLSNIKIQADKTIGFSLTLKIGASLEDENL